MKNLFSLKFWFDARPDFFSTFGLIVLGVFISMLIVGSVVAKVLSKKRPADKKILSRLFSFGLTNGFVGLLIIFLTYEQIPALSSRIWFVIWFFVMIGWGYMIYRGYQKILAKKMQSQQVDTLKKYIP